MQAAVEEVVAAATGEVVRARAAVDPIVAGAAVDRVRAVEAADHVVGCSVSAAADRCDHVDARARLERRAQICSLTVDVHVDVAP